MMSIDSIMKCVFLLDPFILHWSLHIIYKITTLKIGLDIYHVLKKTSQWFSENFRRNNDFMSVDKSVDTSDVYLHQLMGEKNYGVI